MTSTRTISTVDFENPPLLDLLLKLSVAFKVLYIDPPNSNVISPPNRMAQRGGESYAKELEDYKEQLAFLNSDKDSNWMEIYFEDAIRFPGDRWGPTGYIFKEPELPESALHAKRKYTDMTTSALRYNQGGDFLPEPNVKAEADEVTLKNDQPSSSRRRLN